MRDSAITRARFLIVGLLIGPLVLLAIVLAIRGEAKSDFLDMPAMLAGLFALPIAWRLHATLLERGKARRDAGARIEVFVRAIILAMAITEAAALFGIIAHLISRELAPLIGVAMHVMLGGVLWPSRERLDAYWDEPEPAAES